MRTEWTEGWTVAAEDLRRLRSFSAVCYAYAKELARRLDREKVLDWF